MRRGYAEVREEDRTKDRNQGRARDWRAKEMAGFFRLKVRKGSV